MSVRLETERLILRQPEAGDVDRWMAFATSERSKFVRAEDLDDERAWRAFAGICGHWTIRGYGTLVFALKDAPEAALGMTGPWKPHSWPEAEIGWTLWNGADEGEGFVREAAEAARAWAYRDLGWTSAVSYIDARNTRSVRLAERLGATADWDAKTPHGEQCVVFRHPAPEALQ